MRDFNIQCPMSNVQFPMKRKRKRGQKRGQFHKLIFWVLIAFVATSVSASAEDKARAAFDAGVKAFAASNYAAASGAFEEAAAAAPAEKLDPAAAHYNAALSSYAAGDLQKASTAFASAASGTDLDLQAKAYYNRGNALFHLANAPAVQGAQQAAAPSNAPDLGEAAIGQAIQMFENAIALNPNDTDAKANYELAVLKQQEMQQQKQQQQQQKDQQNQDEKKEDQKDPSQDQQDQQQKQDQQNQEQKQQEQEEQQKQEQQQAKEQDSQKEQAKEAQPEKPSEEMTPEEAAMMLDAMKAQEQSQRDRLHPFFGRPVPVEKDW